MFSSTKQRNLSCLVFGVYLLLLVWLVLFKFAVSLSDLPHLRGINLIPFYYSEETTTHLGEVLYNIVVFIPLGVYIQIFKPNCKTWRKLLKVFVISLLFELTQYVLALGVSDVTDLITNTVGGGIGVCVCLLLRRIVPEKYITICNASGAVLELLGLGLLLFLLAANR